MLAALRAHLDDAERLLEVVALLRGGRLSEEVLLGEALRAQARRYLEPAREADEDGAREVELDRLLQRLRVRPDLLEVALQARERATVLAARQARLAIVLVGTVAAAERVEGGQRHARVAVGVHEDVEPTTHTLERDSHAARGVAAAMRSGSGLAVRVWACGVGRTGGGGARAGPCGAQGKRAALRGVLYEGSASSRVTLGRRELDDHGSRVLSRSCCLSCRSARRVSQAQQQATGIIKHGL